MRCFALICLAALCGVAAARELTAFDVAGPHGRALLQSSTECSRSVANCDTCTFRTVGSTTRAICTKCATGYVVKASGRACWCAAGYYHTSGSCSTCTNGYYCPGSKSTLASATRTSCGGTGKTTTSATAKSVRECVAAAGYGWTTSGAATECATGFFNPGGNQRKCTACPGGMTTLAPRSDSAADCVAPAGYYYQRGKAVPCAQGTYKTSAGNEDCTACPEGFTTEAGAVAKTSASDCNVLLAGYSVASGTVGTQAGALCAADTYRSGTATYTGTAIPCTACPTAMKTQEGVTGAQSADQCFVPPGYGFVSIGSGATECVAGKYNAGWNREACSSCPTGMTTDGAGAEDDDQCYTPAGYGNAVVNGVRTASACPVNTYGRSANTYGLVDVECHKCPDQSTTEGLTARQSIAACKVNPGYGFYDGAVLKCDYGTYNAGGNQNACASCGDNYNTTTDASSPMLADATDGATSDSLCVVDAGWYFTNNADNTGGLSPCPRGTYKNALGGLTSAACQSCPSGITTSVLLANQFASDCDACKPGYGIAGGVINLASPVCTQCTSSFYSVGYAQGGQECQACPVPEGGEYHGAMVSRPGTITPEDCVGQFVTDGNRTNGLEYNMISMADASLTAKASATKEACQSDCAADDKCQYYVFFTYASYANGTEGGSTKCYHRLAGSAVSVVDSHSWASVNGTGAAAADKYYVLLEAKSGLYAVYEAVGADAAAKLADASAIGTQLNTYTTFADAKAACDNSAACIGMSNTGVQAWRTFSGKAWGSTDSRVKYYGNNLNSWISA